MGYKESENELIKKFARNNIEDINENKSSIGRTFSVELLEYGKNKPLGRFMTCCSAETVYSLQLKNEDKNVDGSPKGFCINPCMIIKEKSNDSELAFKDSNNSVWIIKHC
ncbi:MAG: hypothetical protein J5817_06205 [Treponema sp.]|nr:hypothetical protein [Treponema sp.]